MFNILSNSGPPFISFCYRNICTISLRTLTHIHHLTNAYNHPSSTHSPVYRLIHCKILQDLRYQIHLPKLRLLNTGYKVVTEKFVLIFNKPLSGL